MQKRKLNNNDFAVIFDMDGVFVDSNPVHKKVLKLFCDRHGFFLADADLNDKIFGRSNKDWMPEFFHLESSSVAYEKLAQEKEILFRQMYRRFIKPMKGLIFFLEQLSAHQIICALASSAPPENIEFALSKTGVKKYFQTIIHAKMINRGKPDPEIFLTAMAMPKQPPEKCIVFEDSLAGIKAANRAGAKVIALTTIHAKNELIDADKIIRNFDELKIEDLVKLLDNAAH